MEWEWRAASIHKAPASILEVFSEAGAGSMARRMRREETISETWELGRDQV